MEGKKANFRASILYPKDILRGNKDLFIPKSAKGNDNGDNYSPAEQMIIFHIIIGEIF